MILGVVRGRLYSTINHPFYYGKRMLIVDRISADGKPDGGYLIAIDSVGAGAGETVLMIDEGNSARQVVADKNAPLRSIIIGIVDDIQVAP